MFPGFFALMAKKEAKVAYLVIRVVEDPAVRLERLDGLLARGVITNDEDSARRAAIIDSL